MKLPFKKTAKECFLALDIGTEAVKASVFKKESKKYSVLGCVLEYFDGLRPFDRDKIISKVKNEAITMAGVNPRSLLVVHSGNILKSRVDFQSFHRDNHRKLISNKEEKNIRERILKAAEKSISERFAKESGVLSELHFTDLKISEIKIDGYDAPRLSGYGGENLKFRILASFLPKDYFNNFAVMAGNLGFKNAGIINPIKNFQAVFKISQGVFVDAGGEVTQVCLVKNNKIDLINEFAMGGSNFTRAISENFGMRHSDARILKENYSSGKLSEGVTKRIKELFDPLSREWTLALKSKLEAAKGMIPSNFFLFGGASLLPEFKESIDDKKVRLIYPKDFRGAVDNASCANSPQFTNLISLFYDEKKNF